MQLVISNRPDVSWNATLKEKLRDFYDKRPHTYTEPGNMRGPPLKTILLCVRDAFDAVDGTEDREMACFRAGNRFER